MDVVAPGMRGDMESAGRIVVVSADIGAGHDTAAAELTRRLRRRGFVVDRLNFLEALPRPARWVVRRAYRGILRWLPWGYDALFALTSRSRLSVSVLRGLLRPLRGRMRRSIPPDTRVVVTTYPFANQLLGPLRRHGRLAVPLLTYVTDFVVHPSWLCEGVDVYCAVRHAEPQPADDVALTLVQPLVSRALASSTAVGQLPARQRSGLPPDDRLTLTVADAWGAGEVEDTRAEVAAAERDDPASLVAEVASRAGSAGVDDRSHRLVDSVGDAVAVVAALLQSTGGLR
ncbi:UDP-N-acetylglucosamine--LPS N-acetylglucosamine transferase [Micromonospora sp. NPDC006431]|uniref:MGDG synthase family glycosyltransferase n=1 Tax=Micromonospora sp. NPDC006431 TaxID=3364235 RepID=UPI0036BC7E02